MAKTESNAENRLCRSAMRQNFTKNYHSVLGCQTTNQSDLLTKCQNRLSWNPYGVAVALHGSDRWPRRAAVAVAIDRIPAPDWDYSHSFVAAVESLDASAVVRATVERGRRKPPTSSYSWLPAAIIVAWPSLPRYGDKQQRKSLPTF